MQQSSNEKVRILILEDDPEDVDLLEYQFNKEQFPYLAQVVQSKEDFIQQLADFHPDLILADFSLPAFDGATAFAISRKHTPDVPFIIVSGHIGEERAVELIKSGVTDYALKGKLFTVVPKMRRALNEAHERSLKKMQDEKLRISIERYNTISQATNDVIWDIDLRTQEVYWNDGIKNVFGFTEADIQNSSTWRYRNIHPKDRERVTHKIEHYIAKGITQWHDEYRYRCADGSYKFVYDRAFILLDNEGAPYRMLGAMVDLTDRKKLEEMLVQERMDNQRKLMFATITGQEKERNDIGKELHDNINQILGVTRMYMAMIRRGHPSQDELLTRAIHNIELSINEIRKISKSMIPPMLHDFGLVESIAKLVEDFQLARPFVIELRVDKDKIGVISQHHQLALYRIVQEQLNNIVKHADAKKVIIELTRRNNFIRLLMHDNGRGFDLKASRPGVGLSNMLSRVEFLKGKMDIRSEPGEGCMLNVTIPSVAEHFSEIDIGPIGGII